MEIFDENEKITIKENNQFIGHLKYSISNDELTIIIYYINDKYRGKNYGKYFFDYIDHKVKDNNIKIVKLDAREYYAYYDKLLNYYNKFGFVISDKEKIYNKWIDGELFRIIPMIKKY